MIVNGFQPLNHHKELGILGKSKIWQGNKVPNWCFWISHDRVLRLVPDLFIVFSIYPFSIQGKQFFWVNVIVRSFYIKIFFQILNMYNRIYIMSTLHILPFYYRNSCKKSYFVSNKLFDGGNTALRVLREWKIKSFVFSANHVDTMMSH